MFCLKKVKVVSYFLSVSAFAAEVAMLTWDRNLICVPSPPIRLISGPNFHSPSLHSCSISLSLTLGPTLLYCFLHSPFSHTPAPLPLPPLSSLLPTPVFRAIHNSMFPYRCLIAFQLLPLSYQQCFSLFNLRGSVFLFFLVIKFHPFVFFSFWRSVFLFFFLYCHFFFRSFISLLYILTLLLFFFFYLRK